MRSEKTNDDRLAEIIAWLHQIQRTIMECNITMRDVVRAIDRLAETQRR